MTYEMNSQRGNKVWQGKDETLHTHAIYSDNAGGVDTNHDVTVGNRWAVETGEKTTT